MHGKYIYGHYIVHFQDHFAYPMFKCDRRKYFVHKPGLQIQFLVILTVYEVTMVVQAAVHLL